MTQTKQRGEKPSSVKLVMHVEVTPFNLKAWELERLRDRLVFFCSDPDLEDREDFSMTTPFQVTVVWEAQDWDMSGERFRIAHRRGICPDGPEPSVVYASAGDVEDFLEAVEALEENSEAVCVDRDILVDMEGAPWTKFLTWLDSANDQLIGGDPVEWNEDAIEEWFVWDHLSWEPDGPSEPRSFKDQRTAVRETLKDLTRNPLRFADEFWRFTD